MVWRGDGHALDDAVGIAFQDAAVHERAGVAFVGVADDELLRALGVAGEFPLPPGGKPAPPRPRSPDILNLDGRFGIVRRSTLASAW